MSIKQMIRNLPGIRSLFRKFDDIWREMGHQNDHISRVDTRCARQEIAQAQLLTELQSAREEARWMQAELERLDYRLGKSEQLLAALRADGRFPVKVVFLLEEPSVTKCLLSAIEAMQKDSRFEVVLVNLWIKVYAGDGYSYQRPDIESVIPVEKYTVLESYDEQTDTWLDLKSLYPDYVFYARPYDYYRQEAYHIAEVARYARTCIIPYGIQVIGGEVEALVMTPECGDLYFYFIDNKNRIDTVARRYDQTPLTARGRIAYAGYPGLDLLRQHEEIRAVPEEGFTILWLPRWNSSENNCHFFAYKDFFPQYAADHPDARVILRPHPLCFRNFVNTGEMTEADVERLRAAYSATNEIDEKGSYIPAFAASSVLAADETSMIPEYFLTDKPIVFCKKETHFSALMEKLVEGCYVVESEAELKAVLEQLQQGIDPLRETRLAIKENALLDYGESAGENMKEMVWADFSGKQMESSL